MAPPIMTPPAVAPPIRTHSAMSCVGARVASPVHSSRQSVLHMTRKVTTTIVHPPVTPQHQLLVKQVVVRDIQRMDANVDKLQSELQSRAQTISNLQRENRELKTQLEQFSLQNANLTKLTERKTESSSKDSEEVISLQRPLASQHTNDELVEVIGRLRESNTAQQSRIQELETLLTKYESDSCTTNDHGTATPTATSLGNDIIESSCVDTNLGNDVIDLKLKEYLKEHPDWQLDIEKVGPGWYVFGRPIAKKVYLKVVGRNIMARIGGGFEEVTSWLDDHRLSFGQRQMSTNVNNTRRSRINRRGTW